MKKTMKTSILLLVISMLGCETGTGTTYVSNRNGSEKLVGKWFDGGQSSIVFNSNGTCVYTGFYGCKYIADDEFLLIHSNHKIIQDFAYQILNDTLMFERTFLRYARVK